MILDAARRLKCLKRRKGSLELQRERRLLQGRLGRTNRRSDDEGVE